VIVVSYFDPGTGFTELRQRINLCSSCHSTVSANSGPTETKAIIALTGSPTLRRAH
jgi:hypothetical protein